MFLCTEQVVACYTQIFHGMFQTHKTWLVSFKNVKVHNVLNRNRSLSSVIIHWTRIPADSAYGVPHINTLTKE